MCKRLVATLCVHKMRNKPTRFKLVLCYLVSHFPNSFFDMYLRVPRWAFYFESATMGEQCNNCFSLPSNPTFMPSSAGFNITFDLCR